MVNTSFSKSSEVTAIKAFINQIPAFLLLSLPEVSSSVVRCSVAPCECHCCIPVQFPIRAPKFRRPSRDLVKGDGISSLLYEMAQSLDIGRPDGWEKLMNAPNITGSYANEPAHPSELRHVVETWGLDNNMLEDAYRDIYELVETAIADGVFISQGFVYNSSKCGDVPRPVCLSTLAVVTQIQYLIGNHVYQLRLGHFYLSSSAETIQQKELHHCQGCLVTHQSQWALQQLLTRIEMSFGQQEISVPLSGSQTETRFFKPLLKQFIRNRHENKDAQLPHTDDLLQALQNTARMSQQSLRAKHMAVLDTRIAIVLGMLLKPCFERAGIQESVSEWWERAYAASSGSPISVECEFFDHEREPLDSIMRECFIGSNVNSQTLYTWGLIQEHEVSFDVLFLENDLTVNYVDEFARHLHLSLNLPSEKTAGSNVRTAAIQLDGSFHDVEFLSVPASLGCFIPQHSQQVTATTMVADPSFAALMSSIQIFAKTWQEVVKAFGSSTTQTSLDYKVDTMLLKGVSKEAVLKVVDLLARRAQLSDNEDLKLALELVTYTDDFTWLSNSMQYVQPTGEASFAYLGKYGNDTDHRAKIVFSQVHSSFSLAKDMLIMFWQMMSYHQIVMALGEEPPAYLDLSFLCDRTIP
ncbi:hypothetical protein BGZ92_009825 [Podila epicladia]|nr:hypothetical protein BGZ92_009825 [Podila epicladia]